MFRKLLPVLSLALAAASALALPSAVHAPAPPADDNPLLECMEGLKSNLRQTAMAMGREDHGAALKHVAELQRFVLQAKLLDPSNLDEVDEQARAAHRKEFRKDLIALLKELADMELDLLEGRGEAAFERVKGPLYRLREAAHGKYKRAE